MCVMGLHGHCPPPKILHTPWCKAPQRGLGSPYTKNSNAGAFRGRMALGTWIQQPLRVSMGTRVHILSRNDCIAHHGVNKHNPCGHHEEGGTQVWGG